MTQPDRLTVEEVDVWKHEAKLPLVQQMAEQLADIMRENERLRHLLARACGIIGRGKCASEDHIGMQMVLMEGLQAVNPK